jgi:hypothetical protein
MGFLFGFAAWCAAFYGVYLIGEKNVKGFYINIAANVFLIIDALIFGHLSVVFAMLVFTVINVLNIWKWKYRNPDIETKFLAEHPEFVMQVIRSECGVSVTYLPGFDVYLIGPCNMETTLRRQAVQTVLNKIKNG